MALTQRTSSISYEAGYASNKFSTYEKKTKTKTKSHFIANAATLKAIVHLDTLQNSTGSPTCK